MKRIFAGLAIATILAGCANDTGVDSTPEEVAQAVYRAPGTTLTLITVVNNRTGAGGHTGLLVNASQQVIFDPAGSFRDERVVERGDVLYAMSPKWVRAYQSAHARAAYHVMTQEITVTPEQAERALQLVRSNGAVPGAFCANSTSAILAQIDGFESIKSTFYPVKLAEQFAQLPGVRTQRYYEDDGGNVVDATAVVGVSE